MVMKAPHEDRFREAQYRVVEAITGKPRSAQIAQHNAAVRRFLTPPAEKIRRGRPIRVHVRPRRKRDWKDDMWKAFNL